MHIAKFIKIIAKLLFRYLLEIVFLFLVIISIIFNEDISLYIQKITGNELQISNDIILVLLPTILTVVSIVLSLPDNTICGIEMNSFRKLNGKKYYSIGLMLSIGIIIFIIYSFFGQIYSVLSLTLSIISVIYSFIFLFQEIPLLLRDKNRIIRIIRQGYYHDNTVDELKDSVKYLLFNDGMKYVFLKLNKDRKVDDKELLEYLLSLQNDFLWKYLEDTSERFINYSLDHKNTSIIIAVEKLIGSIEDIINLTDEMDILSIYGNEEHFYHITRSLFSLNSIFDFLKLDNKYSRYAHIYTSIFMNIETHKNNSKAKKFYYKILNALLINTLSANELWFVKILRDYLYREGMLLGGSIEYLVFIANYFYYLIELEDGVNRDFKVYLREFIDEVPSNNQQFSATTFKQQLQSKWDYMNIEEYSTLLEELLFIYDSNQDSYFWYNRPSGVVYSSSYEKMFSKKILMNWWISMLLTNDMYHSYFWNNDTKPSIPDLSESDKNILATTLNEKWFIDDELNLEAKLPYLELFDLKCTIDNYVNNTDIVNVLRDFKNEHLLKNIRNELFQHQKTDDAYIGYKKVLRDAFISASSSILFISEEIDLKDENKTMFSLLCDTRWSDDLIKKYAEQIPASLSQIVYQDFINYADFNKVTKVISAYDKKILLDIINFKPNYKYAFIHEYDQSDEIQELINQIREIPSIKTLHFPRDVFFKENAVKINFQYCEEDSIVRKLSEDEVNIIVDRDYKQINGLYKYIEGANGNSSVLLTREQIQEVVKNKFFIARTVFKYKIVFNKKKIKFYKIVK